MLLSGKSFIQLAVLAALAAIILSGCGPSEVTISPDTGRSELRVPELKRDGVRIVKVTDARRDKSRRIGTAQVGLFNNRVPYLLEGSVKSFVEASLETLMVRPSPADRVIPVTVTINTFEVGENEKAFGEEGFFACNLGFRYPVSADSIASRNFFTKKSNGGLDVTNGLESLIYEGMAACAQSFVSEMLDKAPAVSVPKDSVASSPLLNPPSASLVSKGGKSAGSIIDPKIESIPAPLSRKEINELNFHYFRGGKVVDGFRGSYSMLHQDTGSQTVWGLGISFTYFDVENREDYVNGHFAQFGGRLAAHYFLSEAKTTPMLTGSVGLAAGSERIGPESTGDQSFFFGPIAEQGIGISFNRMFSIEFSVYEVALINSKLLPSDFGMVTGINIGL